jgi:hypothetical protein
MILVSSFQTSVDSLIGTPNANALLFAFGRCCGQNYALA